MKLTRNGSRYDMYAEDSRAPSVAHQREDGDGAYPVESGPAIEVIELANGETIWWVVPLHGGMIIDAHALVGRS